jgi:hypothetical protein
VMHCHVTTRFDVSSCPAKGGHWLTSSSAPSQVQTPTESIPCLRAPVSMAGEKGCVRDIASFSTRPTDFFTWLFAYPSFAPQLCRSGNLAVATACCRKGMLSMQALV